MTVVVSFVMGASIAGSTYGIGRIVAQERVAVPGTTVRESAHGEIILIGNAEDSMVAVAYGTTPDAAATVENLPTTSASFPVGPGQVGIPFTVGVGQKVNIKAVT